MNAGFRAPDADLASTRRVLEAADAAANNAVRLDGKLIDRARAIFAQTEA